MKFICYQDNHTEGKPSYFLTPNLETIHYVLCVRCNSIKPVDWPDHLKESEVYKHIDTFRKNDLGGDE